ncbi:hypothetical protein NP493_2423g00000 [Ridgeia piscesae]|uniref:LamG domain-containing protein n=1 Tax=Ridgeia piscesae TaxID=27915 RepID=A0AAD9JHF1_RIDPI|nr:hypothetical protein NP493_2423g00000 [Ridgeia piscesae]
MLSMFAGVAVQNVERYRTSFYMSKPNQNAAFIHVVVTFSASVFTGNGRLTVYVNGVQARQVDTSGKIAPFKGDIVLGSINCPLENNFKGYMDSVSFAKHELSAAQVKALYDSHGICIGQQLDACSPEI